MLPKKTRPVGAPRGNRNGWKHGARSTAMRAKQAAVRDICRKTHLFAQAVKVLALMPELFDARSVIALGPGNADWAALARAVKAVCDERQTPFLVDAATLDDALSQPSSRERERRIGAMPRAAVHLPREPLNRFHERAAARQG